MRKIFDANNGNLIGIIKWNDVFELLTNTQIIKSGSILVNKSNLDIISEYSKRLSDLLSTYCYSFYRDNYNEEDFEFYILLSDMIDESHEVKCSGFLRNGEGKPLSVFKIWAFDKYFIQENLLSSVVTDRSGFFEYSFNSKDFKDLLSEFPKFYFKIFKWNGNKYEIFEERLIIKNYCVSQTNNEILIDFKNIVF